MNTINTEIKKNYMILTLNRGTANPINQEMVTELRATVAEAEKDDKIKGLILTGKSPFFTAGLDVIELYGYDKEEIKNFWYDFAGLTSDLVKFSKPLISSITGHSPAGGCVLAICCDYRVMAEGNYRIGLNEIPVGITIPTNIYDLYSFWIGDKLAYQYLLEGKLILAEKALEVGLVDEVVPVEKVLERAEKKMKNYLSFPANAWKESKANFRKGLISKLSQDVEASFEPTMRQWWSPEGRFALKMVVDMLGAKKN
jgi:enoyl-CoA hydratase/carnithine racemase